MLDRDIGAPRLRTPLPGPRAAELIARDHELLSPSYTRDYPLAVSAGRGAVIEDLDGNLFLDFTAGIAVCSTGHCHPRVVRAIQRQAERLLHMSSTDFYLAPQVELARRLCDITPGDFAKRVFFTNSGAEAIEAAIKLARYATRRSKIIAFYGAFHGRTLGALSLTASKAVQRRGFGPLLPDVLHAPFPNVYRRLEGESPEECGARCVRQIEELFTRHTSPDEVAAVFVEPIQGEGGYLVPPPNFLPGLRELTSRHGILLVCDEVQSGLGRTGRWFASEHWGVAPDLVCLAKGVASGMPLGALVARAELMTWPPGAHASTFGGNPLACAAALETIALIEEELLANAREVGDHLLARLNELAERHALVGDVRGRGLMVGVELTRDRRAKEPAAPERAALLRACFHKGLLLLGCGASALRFAPPLVITRGQVDTAVDLLDAAVRETA